MDHLFQFAKSARLQTGYHGITPMFATKIPLKILKTTQSPLNPHVFHAYNPYDQRLSPQAC